jgi:hypothetical protein
MLLSKCDSCGRSIRGDALWCPKCGALTESGMRFGRHHTWHWLLVAGVWCVFLTAVGLNYL